MKIKNKYSAIKKISGIFTSILLISSFGFLIMDFFIFDNFFSIFSLLFGIGCLIWYMVYSTTIIPRLNHEISYINRKKYPFGLDFHLKQLEIMQEYSGRIEVPFENEPTFTSIDQLTAFSMKDKVIEKVSTPNKEFKINDYITVKLEFNETNVYVNDEKFRQCKYLLLNILKRDINRYDSIDSIDDVAEHLNHDLEGNSEIKYEKYKITPEIEFFAHCSNLQSWCEYGYDTRILHSNLSFPLLKRLTEVGDPDAKKIFKEEIAKRFVEGGNVVRKFLNLENYLGFLDIEEILSIVRLIIEKENEIFLQVKFDKNKRIAMRFDPDVPVFDEFYSGENVSENSSLELHTGIDWKLDDDEFDDLTIKEKKKIDKLISKNKKILQKLDEMVKKE